MIHFLYKSSLPLCYNSFMNKAFIFDLDGVLINNEPIWEREKKSYLLNYLVKKDFDKWVLR